MGPVGSETNASQSCTYPSASGPFLLLALLSLWAFFRTLSYEQFELLPWR
jgi:hypothetical protein